MGLSGGAVVVPCGVGDGGAAALGLHHLTLAEPGRVAAEAGPIEAVAEGSVNRSGGAAPTRWTGWTRAGQGRCILAGEEPMKRTAAWVAQPLFPSVVRMVAHPEFGPAAHVRVIFP